MSLISPRADTPTIRQASHCTDLRTDKPRADMPTSRPCAGTVLPPEPTSPRTDTVTPITNRHVTALVLTKHRTNTVIPIINRYVTALVLISTADTYTDLDPLR